jgi:hypothetical protein
MPYGIGAPVMVGPPQSIDDAPVGLDEASGLMSGVGFLLFRTPEEAAMPDSCLTTALRETPTRRHFDPELISFWTTREGRGRLTMVDRDLRVPYRDDFSWGRVRIVDRLGARNSFAAFGGVVTGDRVADGMVLVTMRSPAPIFRLPGHSQHEDRLAEEAMSFFARLVPPLWTSSDMERRLSTASPRSLYAAFLLYTTDRAGSSPSLRESMGSEAYAARQALANLGSLYPADVVQGAGLLGRLGLGLLPRKDP